MGWRAEFCSQQRRAWGSCSSDTGTSASARLPRGGTRATKRANKQHFGILRGKKAVAGRMPQSGCVAAHPGCSPLARCRQRRGPLCSLQSPGQVLTHRPDSEKRHHRAPCSGGALASRSGTASPRRGQAAARAAPLGGRQGCWQTPVPGMPGGNRVLFFPSFPKGCVFLSKTRITKAINLIRTNRFFSIHTVTRNRHPVLLT